MLLHHCVSVTVSVASDIDFISDAMQYNKKLFVMSSFSSQVYDLPQLHSAPHGTQPPAHYVFSSK